MEISDSSGHDWDYSSARAKALFHSVLARLAGRPNRLLSFDQVKGKLHLRGSVYRGVQSVPVKSIVGSVDRYRDFDRAFLPAQAYHEPFYFYYSRKYSRNQVNRSECL